MNMSSRLHCLVALPLSLLLLSGCGSDSAGSNQTSLSGIPRPIMDDGTNTASQGSDTPSTEVPPEEAVPPSTEAPPEEAVPPSTEVPPEEAAPPSTEVPQEDVAPPTTAAPPETTSTPAVPDLENLIGNVRFEFGFDGSSDVFTLEKIFTADSRGVNPINGAPIVQVGAGTMIVTNCSTLPGDLPYFCVEATAESTTTISFRLFLFNLDSARNGTGTFEFCPAGTSITDCVTDALSTPDGSVTVRVDASNAVAFLDIGQQRITTDLRAHHLVAEQAHSAPAGVVPMTELSVAAQHAINALKSSIQALGQR